MEYVSAEAYEVLIKEGESGENGYFYLVDLGTVHFSVGGESVGSCPAAASANSPSSTTLLVRRLVRWGCTTRSCGESTSPRSTLTLRARQVQARLERGHDAGKRTSAGLAMRNRRRTTKPPPHLFTPCLFARCSAASIQPKDLCPFARLHED